MIDSVSQSPSARSLYQDPFSGRQSPVRLAPLRNEHVAMSLDVNSLRSSMLPNISNTRKGAETVMSNTSLLHSSTRNLGIDLKELLAETERFKNKIRAPFVPSLEKSGYFTVSKTKG